MNILCESNDLFGKDIGNVLIDVYTLCANAGLPALEKADQTAASAARLISASRATITGSFPPHSAMTGVKVSAQSAATFFAVVVEPVKANFFTPLRQSAAPVSPKPVTTWKYSELPATCSKRSARAIPTPGVYSLGLKTTVLPAASAYAIEPIGVKAG